MMGKYPNHSRRSFIQQTAKAGLAVTTAGMIPSVFESCSSSKVLTTAVKDPIGFEQTPLPYAYNALEPVIDAATMELHYSKHAAGYAMNLKDAVAAEAANAKSLESILATISKYSGKLRNNGGGHYNHELFWKTMKPNGEGKASGTLLSAIENSFGSFETFKTQFNDAAKTRFGSGWAWLYLDRDKKLKVTSTANQDNPLMDVNPDKGIPLLGLDVWEHAYYLKYQNRRPEYVDNWWKVVNWDAVQSRYVNATG